MKNRNCGCNESKPCGCNQPEVCGCKTKVDLHCSFYSGVPLEPTGIIPGDTGNVAIKKLNDYIAGLPESEHESTLLDNVGGKIEVYKGQDPGTLIHEFKTIQGSAGVIVEDNVGTTQCNSGEFINVKIDQQWIKDLILYVLLNEVDLCDLISGCGTNPPDNQDPVIQNIVFNIPNRSTKVFTETDFAYSDPDGDTLASIKAIGNVEDYRLSVNPYVSDAEVFIINVQQGLFKFVAKDTNLAYQSVVQYRAKDSQNNWSVAANLTVNVAAKIIANFSPVTVELIRGVSNSKTVTVNYTNGNNQTVTAGQVLYTIGTQGQPGYIRAYVQNTTVLSQSGGSFNVVVVAFPYATVSGNPASVNYTIDSGVGVINFTYSSAPVVQDINVNTNHNTPVFFTPTMFTSKFTDLDNDVTQVRSMADPDSLVGYKLNGNDYTGTWINISDVSNLAYYPDVVITTAHLKKNRWQAKDSKGNESN